MAPRGRMMATGWIHQDPPAHAKPKVWRPVPDGAASLSLGPPPSLPFRPSRSVAGRDGRAFRSKSTSRTPLRSLAPLAQLKTTDAAREIRSFWGADQVSTPQPRVLLPPIAVGYAGERSVRRRFSDVLLPTHGGAAAVDLRPRAASTTPGHTYASASDSVIAAVGAATAAVGTPDSDAVSVVDGLQTPRDHCGRDQSQHQLPSLDAAGPHLQFYDFSTVNPLNPTGNPSVPLDGGD